MRGESIIEDYDEFDQGYTVREKPLAPPKVSRWREAERYFKRYRDTKKVIPLRAAGYGKVNS